MGFMDDIYSEGNTGSGAQWWKASDFTGAAAILIEVKDFKKDVLKAKPQPRQLPDGTFTTVTHEDVAYADITVWHEPADVGVEGAEDEYPNVKINQTYLAQDLSDQKGRALVKTVTAHPTKNYLSWRQVELDVVKKVGAYFDAREAQRKAVAEALESADDVPAWMAG